MRYVPRRRRHIEGLFSWLDMHLHAQAQGRGRAFIPTKPMGIYQDAKDRMIWD